MDQDEGSSSADEAAQHLSDVLLPMDATPTLAAHVADAASEALDLDLSYPDFVARAAGV